MGRLVQPPAPPRAHRQYPSRRSRGALLCPNRRSGHRSLTQTKRPRGNPGWFKPLEAISLGARRPSLAEILVDDADALARPAEPDGAVDQTILQRGAFMVLANL